MIFLFIITIITIIAKPNMNTNTETFLTCFKRLEERHNVKIFKDNNASYSNLITDNMYVFGTRGYYEVINYFQDPHLYDFVDLLTNNIKNKIFSHFYSASVHVKYNETLAHYQTGHGAVIKTHMNNILQNAAIKNQQPLWLRKFAGLMSVLPKALEEPILFMEILVEQDYHIMMYFLELDQIKNIIEEIIEQHDFKFNIDQLTLFLIKVSLKNSKRESSFSDDIQYHLKYMLAHIPDLFVAIVRAYSYDALKISDLNMIMRVTANCYNTCYFEHGGKNIDVGFCSGDYCRYHGINSNNPRETYLETTLTLYRNLFQHHKFDVSKLGMNQELAEYLKCRLDFGGMLTKPAKKK